MIDIVSLNLDLDFSTKPGPSSIRARRREGRGNCSRKWWSDGEKGKRVVERGRMNVGRSRGVRGYFPD